MRVAQSPHLAGRGKVMVSGLKLAVLYLTHAIGSHMRTAYICQTVNSGEGETHESLS